MHKGLCRCSYWKDYQINNIYNECLNKYNCYREKLIKIENQARQNSFKALDAYRGNINGNNN